MQLHFSCASKMKTKSQKERRVEARFYSSEHQPRSGVDLRKPVNIGTGRIIARSSSCRLRTSEK